MSIPDVRSPQEYATRDNYLEAVSNWAARYQQVYTSLLKEEAYLQNKELDYIYIASLIPQDRRFLLEKFIEQDEESDRKLKAASHSIKK